MEPFDPLRKSVKQQTLLLLTLGLATAACLGEALASPEEAGSEEKSPRVYRVKGTRDGPSFFPEMSYPEVQPLKMPPKLRELHLNLSHTHKNPASFVVYIILKNVFDDRSIHPYPP